MPETLDVEKVWHEVVDYLAEHDFIARDADGNDFGRPGETTKNLRFKVGTSRGEVAVQVWRGNENTKVIRVLNERQVPDAVSAIRFEITKSDPREEPFDAVPGIACKRGD